MLKRLRKRASDRKLHGHKRINRQRLTALAMIISGLCRVVFWLCLIAAYFLGFKFAHQLFSEVWFVALISLYANAATDWGQVAASLAQLTAGDAHADAENARVKAEVDYKQLDTDIAELAALQPGPKAQELVSEIRTRLGL